MPQERPWFQFYARDWLYNKELSRCSPLARSVLIDLMCLAHEGSIYGHLCDQIGAILDPVLASKCRTSVTRFRKAVAELEGFKRLARTDTDILYVPRMVRDEEIRLRRANGGHLSEENPNCHKKGYPSTHPSVRGHGDLPSASASASDTLSENGFIDTASEEKTANRAREDGKPQSNPPLAPEQAEPDRPGNSQSVVHANGNGNGKVLALVPQPNQPDLFPVFWGLFVAAGKRLNVGEQMSCETMWRLYGEPEQRRIIAFVVEQMKTKWRNEQYTPMPSNALRKQGWTAVGSPRKIPDVSQGPSNGAAAITDLLKNSPFFRKAHA